MLQRFDERNRTLIVNVDGVLTHRNEARVSPFDSSVQGGDAVWEGLRLYEGRIYQLEEHLSRLRGSAEALSFQAIPTNDHIIDEIRRTLEANGMRDGVHIRLTLTRGEKITSGMDPRLNQAGPTLIVLAEFKPPVYDKTGIRLATSSFRRPSPEVLDARIHHNNLLNSILAKIEANARGVDDALMLDRDGHVAETNATHVFAFIDSVVTTGRVESCPDGITRAAVLEICRAEGIAHEVRDLTVDELCGADEVFCTGTMGELAPVVEIDGKVIGTGVIGPVTERLSDLFAARTATEGTRLVD